MEDRHQRSWTTARLSARPPTGGDAPAVLALHSDPRTVAHDPGDRLADLGEAEELLQRWLAHWDAHDVGYWLLSRRGEGPVLGVCGVKRMVLAGEPVWNLLYRLEPAAWGHGLATEAAAEAVARARRHRLRLPVVARVRPANLASARVALAVGLRRAPELDTADEDGPQELYAISCDGRPGGRAAAPPPPGRARPPRPRR